jgi:hypothetical protein
VGGCLIAKYDKIFYLYMQSYGCRQHSTLEPHKWKNPSIINAAPTQLIVPVLAKAIDKKLKFFPIPKGAGIVP